MSDSPRPHLSRWGVQWRYGLAIGFWVTAVLSQADFASTTRAYLTSLDALIGLAGLLVIRYRYRFPVALAVGLGLTQAISASLLGTAWWAFLTVTTRRKPGEIVLAATAGIAGMMGNYWLHPGENTDLWYVFLLVIVIYYAGLLAIGIIVANRREIAAQKVREAELRVESGKVAERQRIAREMHDALAHRISLVSMHASALAYREDLSPAEIRQAASVIEQNAHLALTELRGVLGSLRQDGEKPQPSFTDLPGLIEEASATGQRIDFDSEVEVDQVPLIIGRHAYRVVQEGLTNARKHAPDTTVTVRITGGPDDGLTLRVSNPLGQGSTIPGASSGLTGLSERAELTGGRISYGVVGHRFDLEVWLPW